VQPVSQLRFELSSQQGNLDSKCANLEQQFSRHGYQEVVLGRNIPRFIDPTLLMLTFSGSFEKLRKANVNFVMFVPHFVRMEQLGARWTDFD
jgi:hypothetical protein